MGKIFIDTAPIACMMMMMVSDFLGEDPNANI